MDENQAGRMLARAAGGVFPYSNMRELFVRQFASMSPRSEQDTFFDCQSSNEDCGSPGEPGHDAEAMRCALERTAANIQMMLSSLNEMPPPSRPIGFTLEITTTLVVNDDTQSATCGRVTGQPVTVQMPLQFDPRTRQLTSSCPGKQQHQEHQQQHQHQHRQQIQASICECRSIGATKLGSGKSDSKKFLACDSYDAGGIFTEQYKTCDSESCGTCQTDSDRFYTYDQDPSFMGSCGDSTSRVVTQCRCTHTCWFEQDSREVISITAIPCSKPCSMPEPVPEPPMPPIVERPIEIEPIVEPEPEPAPPPPPEPLPVVLEESETESEAASEESVVTMKEPSEHSLTPPPTPKIETPVPEPAVAPAVPAAKRYFLARPQHKEFSNCSPCRYDPSPIVDDEGNVFCPGNCGCCQCAWKPRSFEDNVQHEQVKVCRCITRGTIFTSFEDRETCSATSSFDLCPCREKAEAKFLELYHCEMWSAPDMIRGREVQLSEIKELLTPYPHTKGIPQESERSEKE
ncbi:GL12128 [Drosophila persimilis]|uniref:GL12128 n=1 Tax=Drosophila persimilis TaxID=7234 RepID=B4GL13_DROPE|nr:GL12128 [Drosophila persimilis]